MPNEAAIAYMRKGSDTVAGWLARADSEIFLALMTHQERSGSAGSVVEIGVHHGKSFILLCLANGKSSGYAIDIFEKQELNIDHSGHGDKQRLIQNLEANGIDLNGIVIDPRASTEVSPQDIISKVGRARFFHIDGGHHIMAVTNDLELADQVLKEDGVVAIDDFFRPQWPDVSAGVIEWLDQSSNLVPFAIGFNKLYLSRPDKADEFRTVLKSKDFLQMYFSKKYKSWRGHIDVYQSCPAPPWSWWKHMFHYLRINHPDLAWSLFRRTRNIHGRGRQAPSLSAG